MHTTAAPNGWSGRQPRPVVAKNAAVERLFTRCRVVARASSPQQTAAATAEKSATTLQHPVWSSYVSRRINIELALEEAVEGARKGHQTDWDPDLAVVFLSSCYAQEYTALVGLLRSKVPSLKHIVGSTGYGVIGSTAEGPEEIEHAPALSLTLASLPGTHISLQHVTGPLLPDGDAPPEQWARLLGVDLHSPHPTNFIMLVEPEFTHLTALTAGLDFAFPAAKKIGGLISAGKLSPTRAMFAWSSEQHYQQQQRRRGQQRTLQEQQQQQHEAEDDGQQEQQQQQQQQGQEQPDMQQQLQAEVRQQEQHQEQQDDDDDDSLPWPPLLRTGAVVVGLQGPVEMELLIAQGCRPLSSNLYTIDTVADGGPVVMLLRDEARGGRKLSPLEALQRELEQVASSRSELMQLLRNMAVGLMPDVLRVADGPPPEPHDFLIRGMALSKAGFMIVGDSVRVGQRVRFMVRDREGAQQDLTSHCLAYKRRELAAMLGGSSSSSLSSTAASSSTAAAAAPPTSSSTKTTSSNSSSSVSSGTNGGGGGDSGDDAQGLSQAEQQQQEQQQEPRQPLVQQPQQQQQQQRRAFGMLLFSCNGRGMSLYDEPSWDSRTVAGFIPVPCSGFMCNGEIGSLGGSTHLHGFTCAAAVLRAVTPAAAVSSGAHAASAAADAAAAVDGGTSSSSSSGSSEAAGSGRLEPGEDKV